MLTKNEPIMENFRPIPIKNEPKAPKNEPNSPENQLIEFKMVKKRRQYTFYILNSTVLSSLNRREGEVFYHFL